MTTTNPHWLALLRRAAAASSIGQLAKRMGYSRTTLSLVLAGKYPGDTRHVARKALALLDSCHCPWLQQDIRQADCRTIALAQAPTHHPGKLAHWRACQHCPQRPQGEGERHDANHPA